MQSNMTYVDEMSNKRGMGLRKNEGIRKVRRKE
jgi:hypothetical protein